jgi:Lsr2
MQLTIDTTHDLDDVLRVVGSLFNVTITTTDTVAATRRTARKANRSSSSRRSSASRSARRVASPAEVRAWAMSHGHNVNGRGRVPAAIVAAFEASR